MREHLVTHNGIGHLGGGHQVHLQQPRLQRALGRPVVFEGVQQEGRALLNLKKIMGKIVKSFDFKTVYVII